MKKIFYTLSLLASAIAYSQTGNVGINTAAPAVTLDVVGQPTTTSKLDGVIAPRITGDQLNAKTYTTAQNGALVYVTSPATTANQVGQTTNVTATGYYYFDANRNLWILMNPMALEPWYNQANNSPATANTQNIYQTGKVSVGANNTGGTLSVYDTTTDENASVFYLNYRNTHLNTTPWFGMFENLRDGSFSSLTNSDDFGWIFSVDNNGSAYTNKALLIAPHVEGGGAAPYGFKITEQGFAGINVKNPTENFDIGGTVRIRGLATSGTVGIFTTSGGDNSVPTSTTSVPINPTQTFTATRTVVADGRGVLGTVDQLPGVKAIATKSGTLSLADDTVLPSGNITLPSATAAKGKIYVISYNGIAASITNSIQVNGNAMSGYSLDGTAGKSGLTVQSDGSNWYLISRY